MKKLLIFIVTAALAISFTSCTEECEKNKTADVIITNNTNVDLWFDVTGDDGMTTENRMLKSGENTTYTISAGTAKIWASFTNVNDDFQLVDTRSLVQCDNISYVTPSQTCALFQYTDITVKNETGYGLYFDVWIYTRRIQMMGTILERYLLRQESNTPTPTLQLVMVGQTSNIM